MRGGQKAHFVLANFDGVKALRYGDILKMTGLSGLVDAYVIQLGSGAQGRIVYADSRLVGQTPAVKAAGLRASAEGSFGADEVINKIGAKAKVQAPCEARLTRCS